MMKKTLFSMAAVALLAAPSFVSAQTPTDVNASGVVATYMNLTGTGALAFGTLSRSSNTAINAAGGAGSAARSVDYNQNLTVTYSTVPTNLTATVNGSTANLPVSLTCATKVGAGAWSAASACSSASFDLDVGASMTTGTLGFGGLILGTDVASALAATYNGSFTIVLTAR